MSETHRVRAQVRSHRPAGLSHNRGHPPRHSPAVLRRRRGERRGGWPIAGVESGHSDAHTARTRCQPHAQGDRQRPTHADFDFSPSARHSPPSAGHGHGCGHVGTHHVNQSSKRNALSTGTRFDRNRSAELTTADRNPNRDCNRGCSTTGHYNSGCSATGAHNGTGGHNPNPNRNRSCNWGCNNTVDRNGNGNGDGDGDPLADGDGDPLADASCSTGRGAGADDRGVQRQSVAGKTAVGGRHARGRLAEHHARAYPLER